MSKRELEVLTLLGKGLARFELVSKLCISENTVANHRASLIAKTGSRNTISLLAYAIKNGLVNI